MTVDFKSLALPGVQRLQPYQPGKPVKELERELGVSGAVKLASNENPLGLSNTAKLAIEASLAEGCRYPDGSGYYLKQKLARQLSVTESQLSLGNGSNDILELLARVFLGPGRNAVVSQYAFVIYALVIAAQNAGLKLIPAKEWGHDLTAMANAVDQNTRLIFIANPNNPTGTWLGIDQIENLLKQVPADVIVVLDEAYHEYVDKPDYDSGISLVDRYPNLVVTRTFSKAYGLASLRVGYAISHPDIADLLNRLRQPFNVNSMALAAAEAVLGDEQYLRRSVEMNRQGYQQLTEGFDRLGLTYIPSAGNFIAVELPGDSMAIYRALLQAGVIVRPIGIYDMPQHLRVSIGLPEENRAFLAALQQVITESGTEK